MSLERKGKKTVWKYAISLLVAISTSIMLPLVALAASPTIETVAITGTSGTQGTPVTITGSGFGAHSVAGSVYLKNVTSSTYSTTLTATYWSPTEVQVYVPSTYPVNSVDLSVYSTVYGSTYWAPIPYPNYSIYTGGSPTGTFTGTSTSSSTSSKYTLSNAGGTITALNGTLSLDIPSGAFPANTPLTITSSPMSSFSTPPASQFTAASSVITFSTGGVEPSKPVPVTIHYNASVLGSMNPARLGIYYFDPTTSTWQWVAGQVNSSNDTITASLPHFSTYAVLANTTSFTDMGQATWAIPAVDTLLGASITNGISATQFGPNDTVTRAQFATFLVRAEGLSLANSSSTPFTDVPSSAWYAPYVDAAYNAHLVMGTSATTFDPNAPISREQMAVMLSRILPSSITKSTLSQFSDSSMVASWALNGVEETVGAGLMQGYPGGIFAPHAPSTRAQAAQVIANYLKYIGKT